MRIFRTALTLCILCLAGLSGRAQVVITPAHKAKAAALAGEMTTEEKIHLIASAKSFYTYPVERLGIPQEAVRKALARIKVNGRMELVYSSEKCSVIVDYAHNGFAAETGTRTAAMRWERPPAPTRTCPSSRRTSPGTRTCGTS